MRIIVALDIQEYPEIKAGLYDLWFRYREENIEPAL
jgi:hypothetical protein